MKIFVVGPERMDTFIHNVAYTLRKMGHEVQTDPDFRSKAMRSRFQTAGIEALSRLSVSFRMRDDRRAIRIAKDFNPDLVFVCTRTLEPESVRKIRQHNDCLVICWYGDTPGNVKRNHITAGEYDAVFVKDKRFADDLRNTLGLNAYHLPEACNPDWHKPVTTPIVNHLLVAGTVYGYRSAVIEKLLNSEKTVKIFGPQPPAWVPDTVKKEHTGVFLDHTNKAFEFSKALACINTFAPAERDALNCRIFESCGCGAALLSEHKSSIDEYFEPYVEYLPFHNLEELKEHIQRLESDVKFSKELRKKAARRAHSDHSYSKRLKFILDTLGL